MSHIKDQCPWLNTLGLPCLSTVRVPVIVHPLTHYMNVVAAHRGVYAMTGDPLCNKLTSLPLEIVTAIFGKLPFADRVCVSQVSRLWRAITLDCPQLWSDIDDVSYEWLQELLIRSKNAPVRLHMESINSSAYQFVASCVENHLDHIAHLDLRFVHSSEINYNEMWNAMIQPAPMLETLHLATTEQRIVITADLFVGNAPRLHMVQLNRFDLEAPCKAMQGVTAISTRATWYDLISDDNASELCAMNFAARCGILCPGVKQLRLTNVSDLATLNTPDFPQNLLALQLNFVSKSRRSSEALQSAYDFLVRANFDNMQAIVLHDPPNGLAKRILDNNFEAESIYLDCLDIVFPHMFEMVPAVAGMTVVSEAGHTRRFVQCRPYSLDDCLTVFSLVANLTEVVLGPNVLAAFNPASIGTMFILARNIETLTFILPSEYQIANCIFSHSQWNCELLVLRNLHTLRISCAPGLPAVRRPYKIKVADLCWLMNMMRLSPKGLPRLSLFGISLVEPEDGIWKLNAPVERVEYYDEDWISWLNSGLLSLVASKKGDMVL